MENEYIDIHDTQGQYERARARLLADPRLTETNRALIDRFFREAALGKTVVGRARKKIGFARLRNYAKHFLSMLDFLPPDLEKATPEQIEHLVTAIETDQIRSAAMRSIHGELRRTNCRLSAQYKVDLKCTIKKFYKWLLGDCRVYPDLVEWIDTFVQPKEIAALTELDIASLIERAKSDLDRALVQVLFDGGFRIGELLNVRLKHVTLAPVDPDDPSKRCFMIRVPFSKTVRRTVPLPMPATQKWLGIWLGCHPARPQIAADGTVQASDVDAPLFPMAVGTCNRRLRALGQKVLGKGVHPHLLRHSSATFWSNRLSYFQQCKRFGWTLTSKMPQRYIDRQGIDELKVAREFLATS